MTKAGKERIILELGRRVKLDFLTTAESNDNRKS